MRSFYLLTSLCLIVLLSGAPAAADPVLVAEYPHSFSWSSPTATNEATFMVKAPNSLGFLCAVGGSQIHLDGQTGTYDFFPGDPQEPGFACVAGNVTDGIDDSVGNWVYTIADSVELEGTGIGIAESALFGTASDLEGSEIAMLRLIVDALSVLPMKGGGHEVIGQARWQFWVAPEATSARDRLETASWGAVRSRYR